MTTRGHALILKYNLLGKFTGSKIVLPHLRQFTTSEPGSGRPAVQNDKIRSLQAERNDSKIRPCHRHGPPSIQAEIDTEWRRPKVERWNEDRFDKWNSACEVPAPRGGNILETDAFHTYHRMCRRCYTIQAADSRAASSVCKA